MSTPCPSKQNARSARHWSPSARIYKHIRSLIVLPPVRRLSVSLAKVDLTSMFCYVQDCKALPPNACIVVCTHRSAYLTRYISFQRLNGNTGCRKFAHENASFVEPSATKVSPPHELPWADRQWVDTRRRTAVSSKRKYSNQCGVRCSRHATIRHQTHHLDLVPTPIACAGSGQVQVVPLRPPHDGAHFARRPPLPSMGVLVRSAGPGTSSAAS